MQIKILLYKNNPCIDFTEKLSIFKVVLRLIQLSLRLISQFPLVRTLPSKNPANRTTCLLIGKLFSISLTLTLTPLRNDAAEHPHQTPRDRPVPFLPL